MIELKNLDPKHLADVSHVLVDIDDTLSTRGKLTAAAFSALWRLHDADFSVAVVTGRPAGWCDHIARFWPVDAVIGENGAFYFYHDGIKLRERFVHTAEERKVFRERLGAIRQNILASVPGVAIASDQAYRESDLAIDFCEDVKPLSWDAVQRIKSIFEDAVATAKISSIHVNGWFGQFDKLSTVRLWAWERLGVDLSTVVKSFIYCGDSPNDEPMFRFFPLSVGVANVKPFLSHMTSPPAFLCEYECGEGFCELVEILLSARAKPGS